jgi:DNA-binding response OmpR family regulator
MKNTKVLIVEDDEWLAEQFVRALKKESINAIAVNHALVAIDAIDEIKPNVIILDVLLTGSTAFSLMHELQTYDDTSKIPVILCTNIATEIDLETLKPYGVKKILDKTLMKPGDLAAAVRSALL